MSKFSIEKIEDRYNVEGMVCALVPQILGAPDALWGYSHFNKETITLPYAATRDEAILIAKIMASDIESPCEKIHVLDDENLRPHPFGGIGKVSGVEWMSEWKQDGIPEKTPIEINGIEVKKVIPEENRAIVDIPIINGTYHFRRECVLEKDYLHDGEYEVTAVKTPGAYLQDDSSAHTAYFTDADLKYFTDAVNEYVREQEEEKGL